MRSPCSCRSAISIRYQASSRACGSFDGSVQSRHDRSRVAGSCGSGTSSSAHPCAANSRRRPRRTASASSGSVWSVKNCQGVEAPHSSPMKSIGVYGEVSVRVAAQASSPGDSVAESRSPCARLPIWSWVWEYPSSRCAANRLRSSGRPCRRPRKPEYVPSWKNPAVSVLASAARGSRAKSS